MSEKSPDPFATALADLLAPLARAIVAQGSTLGSVTESMKRAMLNAAIEAEGSAATDSRISVITGLHRKDVRRLRSDSCPGTGRKSANRMALLIGHWTAAPEFQDQHGHPRPLARNDDETGPGFNELVRRVRLDAAPGTILKTLIDQGAVQQTVDDRFELAAHALLPVAGSDELVAAYHATLSAHLTTATHNFLAGAEDTRHFDRILRYSHLSEASIAELEALASTQAQQLLETLNRRAQELQQDDTKRHAKGTFAAGAYILPAPDADERDE
jgi:hypothetical protein